MYNNTITKIFFFGLLILTSYIWDGCKAPSQDDGQKALLMQNQSLRNQLQDIKINLELQLKLRESAVNNVIITDIQNRKLALSSLPQPSIIYHFSLNNCSSCYRDLIEKLQNERYSAIWDKCIIIGQFENFRDYQVFVKSFAVLHIPIYYLGPEQNLFKTLTSSAVVNPVFFKYKGDKISYVCSLINVLPGYLPDFIKLINENIKK